MPLSGPLFPHFYKFLPHQAAAKITEHLAQSLGSVLVIVKG